MLVSESRCKRVMGTVAVFRSRNKGVVDREGRAGTFELAAIGLKPLMVWREDGPPIYDEGAFIQYVDPAYRISALRESDEVYRMFEVNLLHKESGIRVRMTTSEGYFGDRVDYKVIDVFVMLKRGGRCDVIGLDPLKKLVITTGRPVPYSSVSTAID